MSVSQVTQDPRDLHVRDLVVFGRNLDRLEPYVCHLLVSGFTRVSWIRCVISVLVVVGILDPAVSGGGLFRVHVGQVDGDALFLHGDHEVSVLPIYDDTVLLDRVVVGVEQSGEHDDCLSHVFGVHDTLDQHAHAFSSIGDVDVPGTVVGAGIDEDNVRLEFQ